MSLNDTPSGERVHIGLFGRTNAGKSSLMNALIGQSLAVVSSTKGTTTDPVKKSMELLPIGPVTFVDTPGLDDEGELGEKRMKKAYEVLSTIDIALLVFDVGELLVSSDVHLEQELFHTLCEKKTPTLLILNKAEGLEEDKKDAIAQMVAREFSNDSQNDKTSTDSSGRVSVFFTSAISDFSGNTDPSIHALREAIAAVSPREPEYPLVKDLLSEGELVVLVIPIDSAAPKGRLILPQQQVIRDVLEAGACPMMIRNTEYEDLLKRLPEKPRMVITDSQAFGEIAQKTPEEIPLTSFSILMSRYKGNLPLQAEGAKAISSITNESRILISEGCTHHRQCEDIGTVKLPNWIREFTGKDPEFSFTSGGEFPEDLKDYDLVIHCGGCTLSPQMMRQRIETGARAGVPITNYGTAIAYMKGILPRVLSPFA